MNGSPSIFPFPVTTNVHSNTVNSGLFGQRFFDKAGNEFQMVVAMGSSVATFHGGFVGWHTTSNVTTGYRVTPDISQATSAQAPAGICMASIAATSVQAGNRVFFILKKGNPRSAGLRAIVTQGGVAAGNNLCISASDGRFGPFSNASIVAASLQVARNVFNKVGFIVSPSADGATSLITSTRITAVRVNCP